jgi:hypothetical protein
MEVSSFEFKEFQRYKLISELSLLVDRVKLFETKHKMKLEEFEKQIKKSDESFADWDDMIEWKAYSASVKDVKNRLELLKK